MKRSWMNRGTVQLQRTGRWRAKLTARRQAKRERASTWSLQVKSRELWCQAGRSVYVETAAALKLITLNCTMRTTDAHHIYSRGRAGRPIDELWNGLGCCNNCHMAIHANPIEAQALGLMAKLGACCDIEDRETA